MELSCLAPELLELIVAQSMPEGFESLALTCKDIYALCRPFLGRHNIYRKRFQTFTYNRKPCYGSIHSAYELILYIAANPAVARYIQKGEFAGDGWRFERYIQKGEFAGDGWRFERHDLVNNGNAECSRAVANLLAASPYLKQAGLDWEEYRAEIDDDLKSGRYSQCAAEFLLTLLPNIKTLTLPDRWKPQNTTTKLLDAIVRKATQDHHSCAVPSLAQVTRLEPRLPISSRLYEFEIAWMCPFWSLPQVRVSHSSGCVSTDDSDPNITSPDAQLDFGKTLEVVHLFNSRINDTGITSFLKHTPRLKRLVYQHSYGRFGPARDWDLCRFVHAIGCEVGSHLEELSVSTQELGIFIAPGKASMRAFQRLRKLEVPLELVICNIADSAAKASDGSESLIRELVPPSIHTLSLVSRETDYRKRTIEILFHNLAAHKKAHSLALKEIYLVFRNNDRVDFQRQFSKVLAETQKASVDLHVRPYGKSRTSWQMDTD